MEILKDVPRALRSVDGELMIEYVSEGLSRITSKPTSPNFFVSRKAHVSGYPPDLINQIFQIKGLGYVCDEIAREEDPSYVQFDLEMSLLAYLERQGLRRKRLLDFGCGSGASTMVLHRMLPETELIGVELDASLLSIARARARHYGFPEHNLMLSPSGEEIPAGLGQFDCILMAAVYEHLLPAERSSVLPLLWKNLAPGGCLLLTGTPYRYTPVETHTTGLPFINYLPDRAAHWAACRFSRRLNGDESWPTLLRRGIRGGTESEILGILAEARNGKPTLLNPVLPHIRDRIDLWLLTSQQARLAMLKKTMYCGYRVIKALTGQTVVPTLTLAIQKGRP